MARPSCYRPLQLRSVTVPSLQTRLPMLAEFARSYIVTTILQLTSAPSEPMISWSSRAVAKLTFCEARSLTLVPVRHCLRIAVS
ncbi:MAG: hypothetical protein QOI94_1926 [Acidobacteriaceae bacterium]|jgi:hypothetical protein|nr:hypothetical protein [Acidobacteriaceae bacterium]